MVEFALILPLLLFVIWGIVDISRAFQTIDNLTSAVREGARLGAVMSSAPDQGTNKSAIKTIVASAFQPIGAPIDTSRVTVAWDGTEVTVSASYQYQSLTPLLWAMTISRSAVFRWEPSTAP
jgi:Flp pilus assembly protein TadG